MEGIIRKMGFNGPFHCVRTSRSLLVSIKIEMTGMLLSIVHCQVEKTLTKTWNKKIWQAPWPLHYTIIPKLQIGNFRVPPGLCIKTRLSEEPLIWKRLFTRKVLHVASFWKKGFLELGSNLLPVRMWKQNQGSWICYKAQVFSLQLKKGRLEVLSRFSSQNWQELLINATNSVVK